MMAKHVNIFSIPSLLHTSVKITHNNLFLCDQGILSCPLLAQTPRQDTLAPEQERYVSVHPENSTK